jgi:hypothetical protein
MTTQEKHVGKFEGNIALITPWRVMGGVETQQLSQQGAHERRRLQTEQHQHAEQRLYTSISEAQRRSPFPFLPRWAGRKVG